MFTTLVSTAQVADHLGDWAIVDCRFDLTREAAGRESYLAGHIPGAAYASLADDLSGTRTGTNGRHPLPSVEAAAETFSSLGIDQDTQVVAYDADNGMFASRLWWMLRYLGHDAVAVLDGGFNAWVGEGRNIRTGSERRTPTRFVPQAREQWLVTIGEMEGGVSTTDLLVDARAPERFEGRSETLDRAAGHIPGAVNRCFKDNVDPSGRLRPALALRPEFDALLKGRPANQVVMYCGSGVTACQNLLAFEHAGLTGARLYAGSWSEWSADASRPVETGPARTGPQATGASTSPGSP